MTSAPADRVEPWVWRISAIVIIGALMTSFDTTIVNIALSSLTRDLHTSIANVQWVATGYLLALAAVIPVAGWAARKFGAKNVYLISLVLFTGGSMLCGVATSINELIVFRVLQGIGGGLIMPVSQLIIASAAGPKRMGRVMSVISLPGMLGPILGPVIGGAILASTTWRWIFFVNVPIGLFGLLVAWRGLPRSAPQPAGRLDVLGLLLLGTGIPAVTYGLSEIGSTGGFPLGQVIVPTAVGAIMIVAFVFHALHVPRPLLDLRLYRHRTFSSASLMTFCFFATVSGTMVIAPLYYQQVRDQSVLVTGLLMGPAGVGGALAMPFAGRLTDRFGGGPPAIFGTGLLTIATIPFALLTAHSSLVWLSIWMLIRGVGMGSAVIPAMAATFTSLRPEELSDATPQMNVQQRVGGSIGIAVLAVVLQRSLVAHGGTAATAAGASAAYATAFWVAVVLSAIAIVPCVVLLREERRGAARPPQDSSPLEVAALTTVSE
jgi:EmrB/QacA subfamily drug resistance transporter